MKVAASDSAIRHLVAVFSLSFTVFAQPGLASDLVISTAPLHPAPVGCPGGNAGATQQVEALLQQNAQLARHVRELRRQLHDATKSAMHPPARLTTHSGQASPSARNPVGHPESAPTP
ncbi:MAG: hypothetical protein ACLPXB_06680 [Thiobacillaceae bacterium]